MSFEGQRVKVYRNLHKDTWSLMAADGTQKGRVIGYADQVHLALPELRVGEASRQRAIRERSRNVHAFVIGTVTGPESSSDLYRVRYNPFRSGCFHTKLGTCVFKANHAFLDEHGALWMDVDVAPDLVLLLAAAKAQLADRFAGVLSGQEIEEFFLARREEMEATVKASLEVLS